MGKRVTIDDIAQAMGKSKGLVSMALGNKPGVNEETRNQIVMTAVRMGYEFPHRKSGLSRPVNERRRRIFICFYREMMNDTAYWMEILYNIEKHLNAKGYYTQLYGWSDTDNYERVATDFYHSGCAGIITLGSGMGHYQPRVIHTLNEIRQFGLPMVMVDSSILISGATHVKAANYSGAYDAMQYLYDRGHRRICVVGSISEGTFAERQNGARRYASRNGKVELSLVDQSRSMGIQEQVNVEQLTEHLKSRASTAYLCVNDAVASWVYTQAKILGLRIPEDISVMGFDNTAHAQWMSPSLTTCAVDRNLLAETAVETLDVILNPRQSRVTSCFKDCKIEIPVCIVERESVKRLTIIDGDYK